MTSAIQLARLSGFSPIITTASLKNAALLKSYGATHVLDRNLSADALRAEVTKLAGGLVPVVYDAISTPETQSAAYGLLAPGGKLLILLPGAVTETSEGRTVTQIQGVVQVPHNADFGKALFGALPGLLESGDIKVSLFDCLSSIWPLTCNTVIGSRSTSRSSREVWVGSPPGWRN